MCSLKLFLHGKLYFYTKNIFEIFCFSTCLCTNFRCEAFPSYPRTYDLVHADNLLSLQTSQHRSSCSLLNIFTEIDRLLRPEGWVIIRDTAQLVETARALTAQLKWEARVVEVESSSEQRLLICQKPFTKRQSI